MLERRPVEADSGTRRLLVYQYSQTFVQHFARLLAALTTWVAALALNAAVQERASEAFPDWAWAVLAITIALLAMITSSALDALASSASSLKSI